MSWSCCNTPQEILAHGIRGSRSCSHIPEEQLTLLEAPGIEIIFAYEHGECERDMVALVKLEDMGYAVLHEGEDYTGHGCQCDADLVFFKTFDEAYRLGLTDSDRDEFQNQKRNSSEEA